MAEDMTGAWFEMLPVQYQRADSEQVPEYPLRRWLEGPGSILTDVRRLMDEATDGTMTNPATASPAVLRWLAVLLGVQVGSMSDADMRVAVLTRVRNGAPFVGTREHIGIAAMYALGDDAPLAVFPDPKKPWIVYVMTDELHLVNSGGVAAVRAKIVAYGATPAGHVVIPVAARATWDSFDAAAGTTWAEYVAKVRTWADHDSLGVILPTE